jgi:hypothetical protein
MDRNERAQRECTPCGGARALLRVAAHDVALFAVLLRFVVVLLALAAPPNMASATADFDALVRQSLCAHAPDGSSSPVKTDGSGAPSDAHDHCPVCLALQADYAPPPAETAFAVPWRFAARVAFTFSAITSLPRLVQSESWPRAPPLI